MLQELGPSQQNVGCESMAASSPTRPDGLDASAVCMHASSCRWPGGATSKTRLRSLLLAAGDAVATVPAQRWTLSLILDVDSLTDQQRACVSYGSFLCGAELFDGRFFSMSPAESAVTDPQQRLLLEASHDCLHAAHRRKSSVLGSDTATIVGIERPDWSTARQLLAIDAGLYGISADNQSIAAGRLPFVLGLHGPTLSLDTACSSALVVLHLASSMMQQGEGSCAVAAAVSLKLVPFATIAMASAGVVSIDGRCKTFDVRANGMVRTEGLAAELLQLSDTSSRKPVLLGGAVQSDGRSASLTAPNGATQQKLLRLAFAAASLAANQVNITEAHGTGTKLGDPTEGVALRSVLTARKWGEA